MKYDPVKNLSLSTHLEKKTRELVITHYAIAILMALLVISIAFNLAERKRIRKQTAKSVNAQWLNELAKRKIITIKNGRISNWK